MADEKRLTLLTNVRVTAIGPSTVELVELPYEANSFIPARPFTIPNDFVFTLIGQTADPDFFRLLNIPLDDAGLPLYEEETAETPVPGIYIAGALSRANIILESRRRAVEIVTRIRAAMHDIHDMKDTQ